MELIKDGNLGMLVRDRFQEKDDFSEKEIASMVQQILKALKYLHEEKHIAHRDLKPDNILVEVELDYIECKLTDFGLAFEDNN